MIKGNKFVNVTQSCAGSKQRPEIMPNCLKIPISTTNDIAIIEIEKSTACFFSGDPEKVPSVFHCDVIGFEKNITTCNNY